jgi:hypothetical protein
MREACLLTLVVLVCAVAGSGSDRDLDPSKPVGADSLFPIPFRAIFGRRLLGRTLRIVVLGAAVQVAYWGLFFWLPPFAALNLDSPSLGGRRVAMAVRRRRCTRPVPALDPSQRAGIESVDGERRPAYSRLPNPTA